MGSSHYQPTSMHFKGQISQKNPQNFCIQYGPLSPAITRGFQLWSKLIPTSVLPMFSTLDQLSSTSQVGWKTDPTPNSWNLHFLSSKRKPGIRGCDFFFENCQLQKKTWEDVSKDDFVGTSLRDSVPTWHVVSMTILTDHKRWMSKEHWNVFILRSAKKRNSPLQNTLTYYW